MKNKQLNRNLFIIVATFLLFAFGYYFYLEVYTIGNEAHIIKTKSRILEQMSKNLIIIVNSTGKNSKEYLGHLMDLSRKNKKRSESGFISMLEQKEGLSFFNTNLEYVGQRKPGKGENIHRDSVIEVYPEARPDYLYFTLALGNKFEGHKNKAIEFRAKYDLLMAGFIQRNIFDQYILIVDSTVVYSTLPVKPILTFNKTEKGQAQVAETNLFKEALNGNIDLKTLGQASISGVTHYNINISNNQYKMFVSEVKVANKTWHICGLVDIELINKSKRAMAPWIVILIFMLLALIVLGLPFIKLKVMSPTEELSSGTLINLGISLFLITSLTFWFIFFVSNAFWYSRLNGERLKDLSTEIKNSLNAEANSISDQLYYYDSIARKKQKPLTNIANILNNSYKPLRYPYFDYAFWMDATGQQKGILTPFSVIDKATKLSERDYFKTPDEWKLPKGDTLRFRMESIESVTSGVVKVALSKRSCLDNLGYSVIALTGRFYSIIEPLMPQDYKFCIIDGSGTVWFHSDKLRNMQENFITECNKDKGIIAAIYANTIRTMEVNYYDEPYRIHIEPLSPMPLYLVTMFDKKSEHAYQVQSLMNTLLLSSALASFMVGLIFLFFFNKHFIGKSIWGSHIIDIFGARAGNNKVYLALSILLVLTALLYLLMVNPINMANPLLFALIMVMFIFPYTAYAINGFSLKSLSRNLFASFTLVILLLLNIGLPSLLGKDDLIKMALFECIVIALLIVCFFALKRGFSLKNESYDVKFYAFFLMALLLAFSVAPSIKIFEASVNHELVRGVKHDQLALVRQRESRTKSLRNYYALMEQKDHKLAPSVQKVYESRLDSGVYLKFVGTTFSKPNGPGSKDREAGQVVPIKNIKFMNIDHDEDIINLFRPMYDSISIKTKYLEDDSLLNGEQVWSLYADKLVFDYSSATGTTSKMPVEYRMTTNFQRPRIFNPMVTETEINNWALFQKYDILFILLLAIVFYGIYQLLVFGIRRMFGIPILEMCATYHFEGDMCGRVKARQSVMVIGSPYENSFGFLRERLKEQLDITFHDLSNPENNIAYGQHAPAYEILFVPGFADGYYLSENLIEQIGTIDKMVRHNDPIFLFGTTPPYMVMDYLVEKAKSKGDENVDGTPGTKPLTWGQLLLSYQNILSNVNVVYVPENYHQGLSPADYNIPLKSNNIAIYNTDDNSGDVRHLIYRELAACTYLQRYADEIMGFYEKLVAMEVPVHILKNRIILRIMELGSLYYDGILDSCTPLERFVMCDMAHDMIINNKNKKVINSLIQRGLFVVDGCSIRFMNESFRKHAAMKFTIGEKSRLKEKLGETGSSWQGYKLFLVLLVVGLIVFLFIANRSIIDNLNKLFMVIGGGTVLITNITGLLSRNGNTK